ncbi:MAG: DUF4349 domain-containing protein [Patescibacteria group bacterium]
MISKEYMPVINWIKSNKFAALLVLALGILLLKDPVFSLFSARSQTASYYGGGLMPKSAGFSNSVGLALPEMTSPAYREAAPTTDVASRMVVQESSLSLLVKDVRQVLTAVKSKIESLGGYMVNSYLSSPEQAPTGQLTLRTPQEKLEESLVFIRAQGVKVVSENLSGTDVTDQFVDNAERLKILEGNKTRFEEIMKKAEKIEDILRVQQEIFGLQGQIEAIKGQQNYLTKTSEMSRLTVYFSTDELVLPYAPSDSWRPEVIFKQAVRSLLKTGQKLGTVAIWLAVYMVVLAPILLIAFLLFRKFLRR